MILSHHHNPNIPMGINVLNLQGKMYVKDKKRVLQTGGFLGALLSGLKALAGPIIRGISSIGSKALASTAGKAVVKAASSSLGKKALGAAAGAAVGVAGDSIGKAVGRKVQSVADSVSQSAPAPVSDLIKSIPVQKVSEDLVNSELDKLRKKLNPNNIQAGMGVNRRKIIHYM